MEPYIHKVRYYECDRMGVTHHSNYIRIMEEARIDMMDRLGYGFERMEAEGIVSPVISLTCDYKRTTTFQDLISVRLSLVELGPLRVGFGYEMSVRDQVVMRATSRHCFLEGGRPVVLKDRWPEFCRALIAEFGDPAGDNGQ